MVHTQTQKHRQKAQQGYILFIVVFTMFLLATIAFLINTRVSNQGRVVSSHLKQQQLKLVAESGLHHALLNANQANCAGYTDLTNVVFESDYQYSVAFSAASGTPVDLTVTAKEVSGDAEYVLTKAGVTMWQLPVTTTMQLGTDPGKDAYIDSLNTDTNHGSNTQLKVVDNPLWERRTLVDIHIPVLDPRAYIIDAEYHLYQLLSISIGASAQISTYMTDKNYTESAVTWIEKHDDKNWAVAGGDMVPRIEDTIDIDSSVNVWRKWKATTSARVWHIKADKGHGFIFRGSNTVDVEFASAEYTTAALRPKFVLTYRCPCGVTC
jgi:Tfp pilus assembly protein PilX